MTSSRWGWDRWGLVTLTLLAWGLRLPPALVNRFHADEALYGFWGLLIGRGHDPWLLRVPVYKPPLLPYLISGAHVLFGPWEGAPASEFVVRLPGLVAGLLMVPLTAALVRSLYRDHRAASLAAIGVTFSPFAILFSATAFTDLPMVTLGLAAVAAVARGRPGWAGVWAGLACAAKQTGLVWLPLVALLHWSNAPSRPVRWRAWRSLLGGWAAVVALVFAWDGVRGAWGGESFWRLGVTGYGGLRVIWPQELWPRLRGWLDLAQHFFVSPLVGGLLLIGLPGLAVSGWRHRSGSDLLFLAFAWVYGALHWLLAFPVWDRYLLPLVPVSALLLGRVLSRLLALARPVRLHRLASAACYLLLIAALLGPARDAAASRYPVGSDHGAYDGIETVTAFLRRLPEGGVVYQHWLGWHYAYYLFDAPLCQAYWPNPDWLAQDVRVFGKREPRYITFPSWESSARVEHALAGVGYRLDPVLTTTRRDGSQSFTLYRIRSD
ncbi:MAG TPA: DUF2029 domain-containing protein [Chloroflexi bacterium]|nr:DUF2029 domain-containing protein [Chloroflexota bacterium]